MKKIISFLLIGLVSNLTFYVSTANGAVKDTADKKAEMIEKLKFELNKVGVGENSKIEVKLNDGKKVSGYLSQLNQDDFVVVAKNSDENRVRYDQVKKAKGRSHRHKFSMKTVYLSAFLAALLIILNRGRTYDNYPNSYPKRY